MASGNNGNNGFNIAQFDWLMEQKFELTQKLTDPTVPEHEKKEIPDKLYMLTVEENKILPPYACAL